MVRAGRIGAITLPAQLAVAVKQHQLRGGAELGPIVSHPRSKRWTFLVCPDVPDDDMALFGELFRLNATVTRFGAEIALPSPADQQTGFRVWVHAPRDGYRPSGMSIVGSIRACATPRSRRGEQ